MVLPRVNCVSCFMEVPPEHAEEGSLKLLVGERVAERIDGAVGVAQEVGEVEQMVIHTAPGRAAEALRQGTDVVGGPADDECA